MDDSDLALFAADGTTELAFNEDVNASTNWLSRLVVGNLAAGDYYLRVRSSRVFSPNGTGSYTIDVVAAPPGTYVGLGGGVPAGAASVTVHPGGCGPVLGTRTTPYPAVATEVPVLGSAFYVDGGSLPANAMLLRVIGVLPLATPFDLSSSGAPGCRIEVSPFDQSFAMADGLGRDYWCVPSPVRVGIIGLPIEQQLAVLDPGANALGLTVSNRVASVFGITNE
jgi:hypothetical protein